MDEKIHRGLSFFSGTRSMLWNKSTPAHYSRCLRQDMIKWGVEAFFWLEKSRQCCLVCQPVESPRRTCREISLTWLSRVASIWPGRATLFKDARVGAKLIRQQRQHRSRSGQRQATRRCRCRPQIPRRDRRTADRRDMASSICSGFVS